MRSFLAVLFIAWVPQIVSAAQPKAYAVFVASFNSQNNEARGGVAGTAFFINSHRAITAFHVLQPKSFEPAPGFEHIHIWLVHEGEPAIEIRPEYLTYKREQDSTVIDFGKAARVPAKFVYATDRLSPVTADVETEGFMANSVGPELEKRGVDLVITRVPKLERLYLSGTILRRSDVSLQARDLTLRSAPCVQLSYQPIKGFSGGPVTANGKVIGMNSFADPESGRQTWALQVTHDLIN